MKYVRAIPILALLLPGVVLAAPRTFIELADLVVLILDNATIVLVVLGIVVYFYGISTNILKFSEEGGEKLRQYFLWGILVIFVMVSIWGILKLLQSTIFGSNPYNSGGGGSIETSVPEEPFLPPQFLE